MKKLMAISMMLVSSSLWADEFDITMDVVDSDESFDEAIVNRISLPFQGQSADRAKQGEAALDGNLDALEELEGLVNESMSAAGEQSGSGADGMSIEELPVIVDPADLGNH